MGNVIRLANRTGFCFGVRRAIDMAGKALGGNRRIYSLGSIIHNRNVVEDLSKKGLKVVREVNALGKGDVVVISSHGISPRRARRIRKRGIKIIDTTCPFVLKAQATAKKLSEEGYNVIIVGDARHPEIKALVDFVATGTVVVKDGREAKKIKLDPNGKFSIISQTTQSMANFLSVIDAILEKRPRELRIFNTICKDAEERQEAARKLAREVDVMLIVGGRNSANTRRLFEVCRKISKSSRLIENEGEVRKNWFKSGDTIGITSGASTPDWIVKRVVKKIKSK
ncbi:MAG: 4-hydroxy-3-methylbut-2-enyl diphosphate reductase [Candidatus Omnitrophica bacterium]|nr:4-hydroxy-3-methylbut-2-enyl diphosphate reductase [Candidatus Omnitrophota bacterium]